MPMLKVVAVSLVKKTETPKKPPEVSSEVKQAISALQTYNKLKRIEKDLEAKIEVAKEQLKALVSEVGSCDKDQSIFEGGGYRGVYTHKDKEVVSVEKAVSLCVDLGIPEDRYCTYVFDDDKFAELIKTGVIPKGRLKTIFEKKRIESFRVFDLSIENAQ